MAFVDTYFFHAKAGNGGDGVVRWRREKFRPNGGPSGGDGGRGGDFCVRAVRDIGILSKLTPTKTHEAPHGQPGSDNSCTGKNGADFVLDLPVGSIITSSTGETVELLVEGQVHTILVGGEGGKGNEHFKSSTNQRPMQCTKGKLGEEGDFNVELRLIADVGLVGLPNAGKSSLLNTLTRAQAKVGAYPFTTLEPNLGTYHKYIIADIPGLIEGANEGKGLGHKFLRHIARTKVLVHCISVEQDMLKYMYETVRRELVAHEDLSEKREFVVLTKTDMCSPEELQERKSTFEAETGIDVFASISVLDDDSIKLFADRLFSQI